MYIKIRNYPLSSKIMALNTVLLILDVFVSFFIWFAAFELFFVSGGYNTKIQLIIPSVIAIIFFVSIHELINRYTDKKYKTVLMQYQKVLDKLIDEDPKGAEGKKLKYSANIVFTRVRALEGWAVKKKYNINGEEYKLRNGETIHIKTNDALNTIKTKDVATDDIKYFTAADNERIEIEYSLGILKDVKRSKQS